MLSKKTIFPSPSLYELKYSNAIYLLIVLLLVCSGCADPSAAEEEPAGPKSDLKIHTRGGGNKVNYPIHVYAFYSGTNTDIDGTLAGSQTITSAAEELSLSLSVGTYRIVALSGLAAADYLLSDETPTLATTISMKSGNYATTSPLMMGSADITTTTSASRVDITLNYLVISITTSLSGVPAEVTAVSVLFNAFGETLALDGTIEGSASVIHACTKQSDNTWTIPTLYTFAGSTPQTVLSISMTMASEPLTYAYTYNDPLPASTQFALQGTYTGKAIVTGNFTTGEWRTPVSIDFPFGPEEGGGTTSPESPVAEIPAVGTIWNGCLVVLKTNTTDTEADLLLLSPMEWTEISVAESLDLVTAYRFNDWTDWRMPTVDEAKALCFTIDVELAAMNQTLTDAHMTPLGDTNDDRYLCDESRRTFVFHSTLVMSSVSTQTYVMRAVRTMHVYAR